MIPGEACQRAFFPLVHALRSPFLATGSEPAGATIASTTVSPLLKWLVVTKDGKRMLSCKHTCESVDRAARYAILGEVWRELKFLSNKGELSKALFATEHSGLILVLDVDSGREADVYRTWCQTFASKEEGAWGIDESAIVLIDDQFSKELFKRATVLSQTVSDSTATSMKKHFVEYIQKVRNNVPAGKASDIPALGWSKKDLAGYLAWLMCHDPDARAWLYLKRPPWGLFRPQPGRTSVGVVACLGTFAQNESPLVDVNVAHRFLDAFAWGVATAFETMAILQEPAAGQAAYRYAAHSEIHAKTILLDQIHRHQADRPMELPRSALERDTDNRYRHMYAPMVCAFPFLSTIRGFRWASFFEWDPAYDILDRAGWAIGTAWEIMNRKLDDPEHWTRLSKAVGRFNSAANAMTRLYEDGVIELFGDILFARSLRKCPVVLTCRRDRTPRSGVTVADAPETDEGGEEYRALGDTYGYLFLALDNVAGFVASLRKHLPDAIAAVTEAGTTGGDPDYKKIIERCYDAIRQDVEQLGKLEASIADAFADRLQIDIEEKTTFGRRIINHLIWVFLHETSQDEAFQCLAYFPSRIKPNMPSGGCLVAFDKLPTAEDLLLADNYFADYFLARSLLNSEFETDFPCVLINKGFERTVLTRLQRYVRDQTRSAVLGMGFLDMDGLKAINDETKQHILGTVAIRAFSDCVGEHLAPHRNRAFPAPEWFLGRWGGDEFLIAVLEPRAKGEEQGATGDITDELNAMCKLIKATSENEWEGYLREAAKHFRTVGRLEVPGKPAATPQEAADWAMERLRGVVFKGKPLCISFTAGLGATLVAEERGVLIYESLRSTLDDVCYVAKHLKRGTILHKDDTVNGRRDRPAYLTENAFKRELWSMLTDDPKPEHLYYVTVELYPGRATQKDSVSELMECFLDGFSSFFGRAGRVYGTQGDPARLIVGILMEKDRPSSRLLLELVTRWTGDAHLRVVPSDDTELAIMTVTVYGRKVSEIVPRGSETVKSVERKCRRYRVGEPWHLCRE